MPDPEIPKLYYSIGEVSRLTGLDAHVLRYWETEFKELSPRKNKGGKRLYRENDVRILLQIKELLYDKRFTIEGAKKALLEDGRKVAGDVSKGNSTRITEIRDGLLEIKSLMMEN